MHLGELRFRRGYEQGLADGATPSRPHVGGVARVDVAILSAFAAPFMAMLAMLWHQQRAALKQLGEIGQRLARIEGFLGIGTPAPPRPDSAPGE